MSLRFRNFLGVAEMVLVGSLALSIYSGAMWAQDYYVDATNGNDSWQGTLKDAQGTNGPWKTLGKVNETYFAPGDSVLLKCEQTMGFAGVVIWSRAGATVGPTGASFNGVTVNSARFDMTATSPSAGIAGTLQLPATTDYVQATAEL